MTGSPDATATAHSSLRLIPRGHVFPKHAHSCWSIAIVESGTGYLSCAGERHKAGTGAITVLHPGEPHTSWVHRDDGLAYLVFDVDEQVAAAVHRGGSTPTFSARVIDDGGCATALRSVHQRVSAGDTLSASELMLVALDHLFDRYADHPVATAEDVSPSVVRAVQEYLEDRWAEQVTLAELASLVGVSPPTLVRHFRAELGMAPYQYLISRRIDRARSLLAAGRPAAEVAARTGFADQSHLHRHFSRIIGVTPGRFRAGR